MSRVWNAIRRNPSAVLLAAQLLGVVLYPFLETTTHTAYNAALGLFGLVVLFLAILAVRPTPSTTWVSIILGAPMVILTVADAATNGAQPWHLANDVLHALFYAWTGIALIRYLFADHDVSTDEIWSVGATFTVWVWAFAYLYSIIQTTIPHSFSAELSWMDLLFLSGTTMTNTGLSDIVPAKPNARAVVMLQEFAGIMYLALVVGRVVNISSVRREHGGAQGRPLTGADASATGPLPTSAADAPQEFAAVDASAADAPTAGVTAARRPGAH